MRFDRTRAAQCRKPRMPAVDAIRNAPIATQMTPQILWRRRTLARSGVSSVSSRSAAPAPQNGDAQRAEDHQQRSNRVEEDRRQRDHGAILISATVFGYP